uniref:PilZ domain-containing protein n=1 Tax=Rheinheimera sp. BAL341 TaxID=1708203 RepID=A0A486XM00_9GAMM
MYQRIAAGKYQPANPDFPAADKLADRRAQTRYLTGNSPAKIQLQDTAAPCQLLDLSKGGGARILYQGKLNTGDELQLDTEQFGHNSARCVWKKGDQYGLQFAA